jgi:hypothetical protein
LAKKRENWLPVLLQIAGILVPVMIAGIVGYLSLSDRLARLEGQVDLLKEIVIKQVVTETFTTTLTVTTPTVLPQVPGFPVESLILGLALGMIIILSGRTLRRRNAP